MLKEILKNNLGENNFDVIIRDDVIEMSLYGEEYEMYKIVETDGVSFDKMEVEEVKKFIKEYESKDTKNILIFNDLIEQMSIRKNIESNTKVKNKLKENLQDLLFEDALVLYGESEAINLEFRNKDYLIEYRPNDTDKKGLRGVVLNVPFSKLEGVYNVTGRNTFIHNVRDGLERKQVKPIYNNFIEVISSNVRKKMNQNMLKKIKNITSNDDVINVVSNIFFVDSELISTENFWFHHNGLSVVYEGELNFVTPSSINIHPEKFKIINGAQTTTSLFQIFYELEKLEKLVDYSKEKMIQKFLNDKHNIVCDINDVYTELKKRKLIKNVKENHIFIEKIRRLEEEFKSAVDAIKEEIVLKVTIINIEGEERSKLVESITKGLNTQIAVDLESLFNKKQKSDIRRIFNVTLVKPGEKAFGDRMTPMQFVKNYYTFKSQPGKARNFNRKNLAKELSQIIRNEGEHYEK